MKVTPWKVEGKIDYKKLVISFGTNLITDELLKNLAKHGSLHFFLRRKFFFSHRDLGKVLNEYEKGDGFFLYTGLGPSGPMHIGHLIPFIMSKWFQDVFDVNLYIMLPDDEKFLAKKETTLEEVKKWTKENSLDIASLGFNPEKTFIFEDREYIKNMYTMALHVAKKVTFSTAKAVFGFKNETNIGLPFYTAVQAVPTFFEKKICLIPCAIDQDPYWRVQRDVAKSLGYFKTAAIHCKFLPSLTSVEGKMSSSDKNITAIFLHDDEETVRRKIMKYAFSGGGGSVKEHREKGGIPEIDVSFQWLKIMFEEDDKKIQMIEQAYRAGELLTGELKEILIEKINKMLSEHRKRRKNAEKLLKKYKYDGKLARMMWGKNF